MVLQKPQIFSQDIKMANGQIMDGLRPFKWISSVSVYFLMEDQLDKQNTM